MNKSNYTHYLVTMRESAAADQIVETLEEAHAIVDEYMESDMRESGESDSNDYLIYGCDANGDHDSGDRVW